MFLALIVVGGLAAVYWVTWRIKNRRLLDMANKLPGPPTVPIFGNALRFMNTDLIEEIAKLLKDYGGISRFWLGPDLNVIVNDPDDLKCLLSNPKLNVKGPQYKYMANFLGGGILSGSGPTWRKHRKIAIPNYGKRAIESYSDVFNREVDALIERFRRKVGIQHNLYEEVVLTTTYSVCQTLIGLTREQTMSLPHLRNIIADTGFLYSLVFSRMTKWYLQIDPVYWMSKYFQRQKRFMAIITEFCQTIVSYRVNNLRYLEDELKEELMNADSDSKRNTGLSVIDRFLLSKDFDRAELFNETFTVFTSSQEATAKIASYLLLMMAFHPECQEKLYQEIQNVIGEERRPITDDDLHQMVYLDMVFKEIIRLFPIGAMLQRTITEDIALKSYVLPAGCSLVIPIFQLQRDPRYWSNPNDFDPERFSPENTKLRHPNCYIPFSLGPMDCLGRYFGTKLVKMLCVRVIQEFKLSSSQSYKDLRLNISISVASVNGFPATVHPRNTSEQEDYR